MPTRVSRFTGVTTVIAALAAMTVVALAEPGHHRASAAATGEPALTDDDGGDPMFVVPALAPGHTVRRCITVRYSGDDPSRVSLRADVEGTLASQLELTVARGTGARFGDCSDFSGSTVYQGTLAGAAAALERADVWRADAGGTAASYRFTIKAPADLEADPAEARPVFAWTAVTDDRAGGPAEPPGSGGVEPPATAPAEPMPASGTDGRFKDLRAGEKARSRPDGSQHASGGGPAIRGDSHEAATGGGSTRHTAGSPKDGGFLQTLRQTVGEAAKRAAFPLLLLIAMFTFVLLQNRLDRRDPKLALAPIHSTPDLPFGPLPQGTA